MSLHCLPFFIQVHFFNFPTPVLQRLFLEFDTYADVDLLGVFHLFMKIIANIVAPNLSIMFYGPSVVYRFWSVSAPLM